LAFGPWEKKKGGGSNFASHKRGKKTTKISLGTVMEIKTLGKNDLGHTRNEPDNGRGKVKTLRSVAATSPHAPRILRRYGEQGDLENRHKTLTRGMFQDMGGRECLALG